MKHIRLQECLWLFPSTLFSGISIYYLTGQYKGLTRHLSSNALYQIAARNLLIVLIISSIGFMDNLRCLQEVAGYYFGF